MRNGRCVLREPCLLLKLKRFVMRFIFLRTCQFKVSSKSGKQQQQQQQRLCSWFVAHERDPGATSSPATRTTRRGRTGGDDAATMSSPGKEYCLGTFPSQVNYIVVCKNKKTCSREADVTATNSFHRSHDIFLLTYFASSFSIISIFITN